MGIKATNKNEPITLELKEKLRVDFHIDLA